MSGVTLSLGPVFFSGFEIPPFLFFGGAQQLAVHKLPGGARVIDAMGRDDAAIRWTGIFTGPEASARALLLDTLRGQGLVLPLSWDIFLYSVVISEFTAEYQAEWWIPYRISCIVLQDEVQMIEAALASITDQATSDLAAAGGFLGGTTINFGAAQTAIANPGATELGTNAYLGAQNAVSGLQGSIASGMGTAASTLATSTGPLATSDAAAGSAALTSATSAAGSLAALSAAQGYVGRTTSNLQNASS